MGLKADILASLRQDILSLQGSKAPLYNAEIDIKLGPVTSAFPNKIFPRAAVHEFVCHGHENTAATSGFISGILSLLTRKKKNCIWISREPFVYPPSLQLFGIAPENIFFIQVQKEKDLLWTMEEALRCDALAAVVCEAKEVSFLASRRLQLAVEESHITGMIIRNDPRNLATACDARWKITSLGSAAFEELPGVGFPKWNIELMKVRNGRTGTWEASWKQGRFQFDQSAIQLIPHQKKQTG